MINILHSLGYGIIGFFGSIFTLVLLHTITDGYIIRKSTGDMFQELSVVVGFVVFLITL